MVNDKLLFFLSPHPLYCCYDGLQQDQNNLVDNQFESLLTVCFVVCTKAGMGERSGCLENTEQVSKRCSAASHVYLDCNRAHVNISSPGPETGPLDWDLVSVPIKKPILAQEPSVSFPNVPLCSFYSIPPGCLGCCTM